MKRILITGGFGIFGTSLTNILYKKKDRIFLLDRSKKERNKSWIKNKKNKR